MYIICFISPYYLNYIISIKEINGFISLYYLNYIINIKEINGFVVTKCAVYSKLRRLRRLHAGCAQFARSLPVKKIQHRLTRQVAKCPQLRANCANCKQTAPITSHLGH